jgi:acetylornithine deacetylase
MDIIQFTRKLIDIESISWNEGTLCRYVRDFLTEAGFEVSTQPLSGDRFNILARVGDPVLTFSTHLDTVPPFIPSSEDEQNIYGRGACDAKGIMAAQIFAAQQLRDEGRRDFGLLFVVGEEDGSDGARAANTIPNRNRYLIDGEPTESHQAIASKGALRIIIETTGRAAHGAYPELGESAIEKLLDILSDIRQMQLPVDAELGATTYNIGTITGGRKANVVADFAASEVMFRTVTDPEVVFDLVVKVVAGRGELKRGFSIQPVRMRTVESLEVPTSIVRFGTDIPCLTNWGEPLLFGPGSIHQAHTAHEYINKDELRGAVETYARMARLLLDSLN